MHKPVLLKEILEIFNPKPYQTYIDATIDGGGHSAAILEKISPGGTLVGIDRDCELIDAAKSQIADSQFKNNKIILVCDNYVNIANIARRNNLAEINGILFDLGVSSRHFEDSGRGFSFLKNEPLDMRFDVRDTTLTAGMIVNQWPREKIELILRNYGEERFSRRIAEEITRARRIKQIKDTADLVAVIKKAVPKKYCAGRIHCATKTFQALRITVNDELSNLSNALYSAIEIISSGGRIAAISFHSIEDRIVKNVFRESVKDGKIISMTKKVIKPSFEEVLANLRARSAKMRIVEKL